MNIEQIKTNTQIRAKNVQSLLIKRHFGPFRSRRQWLNQTQWLGKNQILQLQSEMLNQLISHCYDSVPYYRKVMLEANLHPDDFVSVQDIQKLPILKKEQVRENLDAFISTRFPKTLLHKATTGGTTTYPLPVYRNWQSVGNEHAFVRRQFDWAGIGLREKCAYLTWRKVAAVNGQNQRHYVYDPAMRELILSTFHLSKQTADEYLQAMCYYNVKALAAYPSAAHSLAQFCGKTARRATLKAVLTSSEVLEPEVKANIEDSFGCRVFDFYGSAERTCYIHTCERGSYHVIPEYGVTEFIPAEYTDEDSYRIIATGFWNRAMPFLRYDTGDMVTLSDSECSCGRNFPVVNRIIGRESNAVTTAKGRRIGSTAMYRLCKNVLKEASKLPVAEIGMRSVSDHGVVLEYVPLSSFGENDCLKMRKIMQSEMPEDMATTVERVEQLTKSKSGKSLCVIYPVQKTGALV